MLRRRRGSVSTPRSGPSLFGLLVLGSPRPGGQPKSQKAFWAACLDLGSFRRAAPRAVGSRSRVGLLARRRLRSRRLACARGAAGTRLLCLVGVRTRPPREARRSLLEAVAVSAMCGLWSNGVTCSEASVSPRDYLLGAVPSFTVLVRHLASLVRHKKTHRNQAATSLHLQPAAL